MELTVIEKIIEWGQTAWGILIMRGVGLFVFSEFVVRNGISQYMALFTKKFTPQQEKFIARNAGFAFNVIAGIGMSWFINQGKSFSYAVANSWWIIIVAFIAHVVWVKWLEKKIAAKYGKK